MKTGDGSYNKTNIMPLEVTIEAVLMVKNTVGQEEKVV